MAGKVLLVRHGATKLNYGGESAEKIRGWLDVPLDAEGMREATRLGKRLSQLAVQDLYCSPLTRARETADRIGLATKTPARINVSLLPWNLGPRIQGQVVKSVIDAMNHYVENEDESPEGGEPFARFRERFLTFLRRKLDEAQSMPDEQRIVCVTHGRCVRCAEAWVKHGAPDSLEVDADTMSNYEPGSGTGGVVEVSP